MPIENRNLEPGTVLVAKYKKENRTCEVVKTDAGLRYRLDDGTEHSSPSSAGKAAMGDTACNGWRFWSVAGTETPKREPKPKVEKPPKAAPKAKKQTAKGKRIGANRKVERAAAKGDSYGCGVCSETFPTQKTAVNHALTHSS